ncbi:MAG: metallophosphoesterase [Alphaproteobacteria bacterium]|nr:metallophosphoesterase [Alphaproteobacteria bacterium]
MNDAAHLLNATSGSTAAARRDPAREAWRQQRLGMEAAEEKHTPSAVTTRRHWFDFNQMLRVFGWGLRLCGLYERGIRNALDIQLKRMELGFANLPAEFDGFRILQLSDLHVDFLPEPLNAALDLIAGEEVDLCVLTGDYRKRVSGPFEHIMPAFEKLLARLRAQHGVYAILGNHDCADMVEAFEALGIDVLINQTRTIQRGQGQIHVTGTDDVHYYYTDAARAALDGAPKGFKIALIHSAELADVAAEAGFSLYLSGHTHGGQICLPGGLPIITHLSRHRRYASGLWRHGSMTGYTTTGIGVSGLPVRFNTRGEAVLITLRRA